MDAAPKNALLGDPINNRKAADWGTVRVAA